SFAAVQLPLASSLTTTTTLPSPYVCTFRSAPLIWRTFSLSHSLSGSVLLLPPWTTIFSAPVAALFSS
ncbi:hypothetical protein HN51_047610, partial [Arachis hypogaea]